MRSWTGLTRRQNSIKPARQVRIEIRPTQHRELHLASAGSGPPIEPAINPAPATASATAIAKMALRMIGSLSSLVILAGRGVQAIVQPWVCEGGLTRDECGGALKRDQN